MPSLRAGNHALTRSHVRRAGDNGRRMAAAAVVTLVAAFCSPAARIHGALAFAPAHGHPSSASTAVGTDLRRAVSTQDDASILGRRRVAGMLPIATVLVASLGQVSPALAQASCGPECVAFKTSLKDAPLKLYYFDVKARAFLPELVLRQSGIPYTRLVGGKDFVWKELKPKMPFGQLPVLEGTGIGQVAQSMSIARFAAHMGGLEPSEPAAWAKSDMLVEEFNEIFIALGKAGATGTIAAYDDFLGVAMPKKFNFLEALLVTADGTPYFDKELSLGDLAIFSIFNMLKDVKQDILTPYPKLVNFYTAVAQLPAIAEYLGKDMPPPYFKMPTAAKATS